MGYIKKYHRIASLFSALGLIAGCGSDPLHVLGMKQVNEGKFEEGVKKLKESAEQDKDNRVYRADYLRERQKVVERLILEASNAMAIGDLDAAEDAYQRVLRVDGSNVSAKDGIKSIARERSYATQVTTARELMEQSELDAALKLVEPILIERPDFAAAKLLKEEILKLKNELVLSAMPTIAPGYKKPVSLQFRDANLKMILEAISKASGINILLDKDIKNDLKATIFVKEASVEDAISLLLMQNQLERKIINENTIFIYPSTGAKLKEYQDLVVRVFQLKNADAKQMQGLLKGVLKAKEIHVNEKTNSIIMRDTPEVIEVASKLIMSQDVTDPEVMLEVEVLEVNLDKLTQIGMQYPNQVTLSVGAQAAAAVSATGTTQGTAATTGGNTLYDWKHLNSSNIKVFTPGGSVDVVANLKGQDSDTNILASPRIRVKQHEKAKIHIGDRVPIITNTVTPVQTGSPVVTGTVQYIDVGLKLEVEPDIHSDGEVGIKTSLEVSSISNSITNASSGSVAYQIGTRNTNTVLKLKDGETQVLAGLINEQEMKSVVKIPGLGDIPVMGRLFSSNSTDKKKTEIILAITPHILKNVQQPDAELSLYWSGTEAAVRAKPITTEKMKSVKINTSPATGAEATPSPVMSNQPQMLPGRLGVRPMVPPAPIPTRPGEVSGVAPPTPLAPASAAASPSRDDQGAPESEVSPQPAAQPAAPEGAAPPVDKKTTTESNAKPLATQSLPQNDLGSSGMSDAVLYSPKAK